MENILISSYFPMGCTGYGTQVYHLVKYLNEIKNINVTVLCWDLTIPDSYEPYLHLDIIQMCPNLQIDDKKKILDVKYFSRKNRKDYWKNIIFRAKQIKATTIIVFQDIICFEDVTVEKICPILLWYPVHNFPLTKIELLQLKNFDKIYSISMYGRAVLKYHDFDSQYIPHVASEIFYDDKKNKTLLRSRFGLDDNDFICLMVARNSEPDDRKAFVENITAFSHFLNIHSNAKLILHSHKYGIANGIDLMKIINNLKINKSVIFSDQTKLNNLEFSNIYLRNLYTISDVLLSASKLEGFGVPIIEAQICNTPVITTNCTAMSENTFIGICTESYKNGLKLNIDNIDYISSSTPSIKNITQAIEDIYNNKYKHEKVPYKFYYKSNLFNLFDF
jgi:glycosyltransferase involved in cell wall biosynthesis